MSRPWSVRRDDDLALVGGIAPPRQQAGRLHALDQRRDVAGVQAQAVGDRADALAVDLPERAQHKVLGIG